MPAPREDWEINRIADIRQIEERKIQEEVEKKKGERTEEEERNVAEDEYMLTAAEAAKMRGRPEYPNKKTFRDVDFPRGLTNYPLFRITGMWTVQDRALLGTHSYASTCTGRRAREDEEAEECLRKVIARSASSFCHAVVSPASGDGLKFYFNDDSKGVPAMIENDKAIEHEHIAKYCPELNKAICRELGIMTRKLNTVKDIEGIDLSDYNGRVADGVRGINAAVTQYRAMAGDDAPPEQVRDATRIWNGVSCPYALAKHIVRISFSQVVANAKALNKSYDNFSSCTYGETELVQLEVFAKDLNLLEDDIVLDLGSGMGNVCMYLALACDIKLAIGIELSESVSNAGKLVLQEFYRTCQWYDRKCAPVVLETADITHRRFRETITKDATLIFINNLVFGQELNLILAQIIKDIEPRDSGRKVRIITTYPLVALPVEPKKAMERLQDDSQLRPQSNNRTAANAKNELSTLITVTKLTPFAGNVSWTAEPVQFYLHVVDHELEDMDRREEEIEKKKRGKARDSRKKVSGHQAEKEDRSRTMPVAGTSDSREETAPVHSKKRESEKAALVQVKRLKEGKEEAAPSVPFPPSILSPSNDEHDGFEFGAKEECEPAERQNEEHGNTPQPPSLLDSSLPSVDGEDEEDEDHESEEKDDEKSTDDEEMRMEEESDPEAADVDVEGLSSGEEDEEPTSGEEESEGETSDDEDEDHESEEREDEKSTDDEEMGMEEDSDPEAADVDVEGLSSDEDVEEATSGEEESDGEASDDDDKGLSGSEDDARQPPVKRVRFADGASADINEYRKIKSSNKPSYLLH